MKKFLLVILTIFSTGFSYSQQELTNFSEALALHLPKYKQHADKAYRTNNLERAEFLFDSLVNYSLKGSRLDNFQVRDLKKNVVSLDEFKRPVYLTTYASWIVPTEGEIPALNKLAEKYSGEVDFILLFWDTRETAKELAKKYHPSITVLYVDELKNRSPYVIKMMKHSLGFPTSFLLNKEKRIMDIRRKVSHPYGIEFEKSFDLNYNSFSKAISLLLINNSSQYSQTEEILTP